MYNLSLEKATGTRDQIANIYWIIEKARESQKTLKPLTCDHNKPWKIIQEMGIPGHLTCLLRNLYTGQEATVRTRHGTMDWLIIGKVVHQGCILSPYLTSMQSTSCEMPGWMNHKLEPVLPGVISID